MENKNPRDKVVELIKTKTTTKRNVFENTKLLFEDLKHALKEVGNDLFSKTTSKNPIVIEVTDKGQYEARIKVGGDTLIFIMHSNVFDFDTSHRIHKTSLVREDRLASLCGQIYVYNFLSDSFKYNRYNDIGYLLARIFINKDNHFFVEGKKQIGFLYNDFENDIIDKNKFINIIDNLILHALEFDLYTPPYESFAEVTVEQIEEVSNNLKFQTAKRMGFKFGADGE